MAAELEFYLFSPQHQFETCSENQCFDIDAPNNYQQVLDEVEKLPYYNQLKLPLLLQSHPLDNMN